MKKHTKEPWMAREPFNGCIPIDAWDGEQSIEICRVSGEDAEHQNANANLIVEAPNLLSSLEKVTGMLKDYYHLAGEPSYRVELLLTEAHECLSRAKSEIVTKQETA